MNIPAAFPNSDHRHYKYGPVGVPWGPNYEYSYVARSDPFRFGTPVAPDIDMDDL